MNTASATLIAASLVLLGLTGELNLLPVLVPISLFLGYGLLWLGGSKTRLREDIKKE